MSTTEFRLPNITAGSTEQQLRQMQSFLHQHIRQLNFAMGYLEGRGQSAATKAQKAGGSSGQTGEQSPQNVFNSIKSLIIKSADIVDAYYEEISTRLSGEYVAQSDFGIYQQNTEAKISANSEGVSQLYENMQQISGTVEGLYNSSIQTSAYIRTGLLDYGEDGSPIYGMEVGQTNSIDGEETFDKMARFTSGRMSFFDANDIEVAYISDYKLYITNAHITGNLIVGRYEMDTSDGLAFDWIGGDV